MPYESQKVVETRRVRVCARCRNPIPEAVNRQAINNVGSLGASLGGSILVGSLLGPVGAIGGAIAGSIAGARAGRSVGDKVSDAVESQQDCLCPGCRQVTDSYASQGTDDGGHRLGSGSDATHRNSNAGDRIGEAASAAGRWMKQSINSIVETVKKPSGNNGDNNNPPMGGSGSQTSGIL